MPKYMFAYHGGSKMPEDQEAIDAAMAAWGTFMENNAQNIVDGGAPVGISTTVSASGVAENGGSNPLSGYSIFSAPDLDAAHKIAAQCPIISEGGSVEIAEVIDIDM